MSWFIKINQHLISVDHRLLSFSFCCSRLLSISDILSSLFSLERMRYKRCLLMCCRRAAAHLIACAFLWRLWYSESSRNVVDGDFRLADAGNIRPGVCQHAPSFAVALVEPSLCGSPEFFIEAATQQFPFCVPLDVTELPTPTTFGSPPGLPPQTGVPSLQRPAQPASWASVRSRATVIGA